MNNKKLPENIQKELNKWFNREVTPCHFWENNKTYYVLVPIDNDIYCVRLWESTYSDTIRLSQDNIIYGNINSR